MSRGRWCRICGCRPPNEKFSGRGHRDCICRDCRKLPKSERDRIDVERELYQCADQSNISTKNIKRLTELADHEAPGIREHAAALLEIARIYPRRRRRWKRLVKTHFSLFRRYRQAIGMWIEEEDRDRLNEDDLDALCQREAVLGPDEIAVLCDDFDIPF